MYYDRDPDREQTRLIDEKIPPYRILIIFSFIYGDIYAHYSKSSKPDEYGPLYYQAPILNVAYMNLSLGLNVPITKTRETFLFIKNMLDI